MPATRPRRFDLIAFDWDGTLSDSEGLIVRSMQAAIDNFARSAEKDKVLVLGAMAEMGADSMKEHQALIDQIGQHQWKAVLLVGADFEKMGHSYLQFNNAAEAGEWLQKTGFEGSSYLVKGSRSMQMEKVLQYISN